MRNISIVTDTIDSVSEINEMLRKLMESPNFSRIIHITPLLRHDYYIIYVIDYETK